jgi:predicted PurR-regulated permease PerM
MIKSNTFINILLLVIGYFIYVTYSPFLIDIAIAILLAISLFNIEKFFYRKTHNKYISTSLITLLLSFILFTPLFYFISGATDLIHSITPDAIQMVIEKAKKLLTYFPEIISSKIQDFLTSGNIETIYNNIAKILGTITTKSAVFLKDIILIIIFFFFVNLYGKEILCFIKNISPLDDDKAEILFGDTQEVMGLVFYSTLVTAIFEGLLFGVFVQFYGFNGLFFAVMYAFASLIPVIGGAIMWLPMSLYLYANGNSDGAIEIALYSIIIISIVADTFIKPLIIGYIKRELNNSIELSPLLIFFSIVAGLSSFGFWGVVLGPAITSLFISILKFYKRL